MKTIALRFGEHFAPPCGTIAAHQGIIDELGYVWYGKLGNTISDKVAAEVMENESPRILLINSGKATRYWANVAEIKKITPDTSGIPAYYRDNAKNFKTWFKVVSFEAAPKDIMSRCFVTSSGAPLGEASKHSMSPYFIIEIQDDVM